MVWAPDASAQVAKRRAGNLDDLAFTKHETWVTAQHQDLSAAKAEGAAPIPLRDAFEAFLAREGKPWVMVVDRMMARPTLAEGKGIPWIPGTANALSAEGLRLAPGFAGKDVPVDVVAKKATDFIRMYPGLFGVDPADLRLNAAGSGPVLDYLYFVDFQWTYRGLPVDGAHVSFRLNHGNLVQFGQERISGSIRDLDPKPGIDAGTAWEILWGYLGGRDPRDEVVEAGRLLVIPVSAPEVLAEKLAAPGLGLGYRLVYVLAFKRTGAGGTWEGRVDAHTGELLSFQDVNEYGHIQGGTYIADQPSAEAPRPFAYANYSGTTAFADGAGDFPGTAGTSTLRGRYVEIVPHNCGSNTLSQDADASGLIDFEASSGTDCDTPGTGGEGNTHSARTQHWVITQIKLKALSYYPDNAWLGGTLTDHVNLVTADSPYCPGNAWWSPTAGTINFCTSGGGYANTGELPGITIHEWAHGWNTFDGGPSSDGGTGETYGDFSAALQLRDSCFGGGFFYSNYCSGYGDLCTSCTGVRDIDYANHSSGSPHFPEDLDSNTCTGCTTFACTPTISCHGPCWYECHCESYISTEALWDFVTRDLAGAGMDPATAWQVADRLWYASRSIAGWAYTCPTTTTPSGCGLANYYTILRVVDDTDGDLSNGTPHAEAIYSAFGRHKIACDSGYHGNDSTGCPSLASPAVWGEPGASGNFLAWTPVPGASAYNVYRNEAGCDRGFTRIKTLGSDGTSYPDLGVAAGALYYYRVQAIGPSQACAGVVSDCVTLPCAPPSPPSDLQAIAGSPNCVYLSWAASGTPGVTYTLYRSRGTCFSEPFGVLTGGVAENTYVDSSVSQGLAYSYQVTAVQDRCESAPSNCDSAVATGTCTAPPDFWGLEAVSNLGDGACGLFLSWNPATAHCGGPVTYNIYRAPYPFVPGPANRIASGIPLTWFADTSGLENLRTYDYAVRAVDLATGAEEQNLTLRSGFATAGYADWLDDIEPMAEPGWTHGFYLGSDDWAVSTYNPHSPTHSWRVLDETPGIKDRWLVSPPLLIGPATELSFWHIYGFIYDDFVYHYRNGGVLEISTDGGLVWTDLGPHITQNGYTNTVWEGTENPLAGRSAWTRGILFYAQVRVDLSAYSGAKALVRWRMGLRRYTSDGNEAWQIDDVQFTQVGSACTATAAPPAVPDGTNGTTPMRAWKEPGYEPDGGLINLTWDTTACAGAPNYHLVYGQGTGLPSSPGGSFSVSGQRCKIGDGQPYSWTNSLDPADNARRFYWWLLVAGDGSVEGSWGHDSGFFERNGATPSPCAASKVATNACGS